MDLEVRGKEWDLCQSETEAGYIDSPANKQMDRCRLGGIPEGRDRLQDRMSTTRTTAMQHTLGMGRCPGMQRTGGKRERLLEGLKGPIRQANPRKG
jgi:hypothetical protein